MRRLILLLAIVTCAASVVAQQPRSDRAMRRAGEEVYLRVECDACHGTVGHGGPGPKLAPQPLPYPAFEYWVRNGTTGWGIIFGMPAFHAGVLSDDELEAIHAYLSGIPEPDAVEDIPLLQD